MGQEKITIWVPPALAERLEKARVNAGFHSIGDLISFVLHQIFPEEVEKRNLSEKDLIEKKLRELGYL